MAPSIEPVLRSPAMRRLDRMLRAVAAKEVGISLVGESGTGKEILARRIHDLSPRRAGPFIPLNCAAVPEALFESELFGHEKGAFTGATERMKGKIEPAHGGTLFLDEIGDMPLGVQAKLLRFLENQKFMRVGGAEKISVDVRVICATLRPLEDEIAHGRFRADLYYRIQGIQLEVPPLRDRREDLSLLIQELLAQLEAKHGTHPVRMTRAGCVPCCAAIPGPVTFASCAVRRPARARCAAHGCCRARDNGATQRARPASSSPAACRAWPRAAPGSAR